MLNTITGAKAKTAGYPFTTLEPNLGVLYGYIVADIPGLIEGAGAGKGLGHKFLRHVKRTKKLLHLISLENKDVPETYEIIRKELADYDKTLAEKQEIIVLTKTDLVDDKILQEVVNRMNKYGEVYTVSIYDDDSIKILTDGLVKTLRKSV